MSRRRSKPRSARPLESPAACRFPRKRSKPTEGAARPCGRAPFPMAWAYLAHKQAPTLRNRALQLLARRDHSRLELKRRLTPHVEAGDDVEVLLDDLTARGWLSEARLAEATARTKARRF